ncbi:MAG: NUDIX hydrolase [Actinomycetales bacterium]|nr:NUDIX hydrolase [Actinomycetales bacterium]
MPSVIRDFPTRHTPALDAHAREWEAAGRPAAPPARPAATVMLVRDREGSQGVAPGVEVFMLLRVATMAFAPNTMVFPGGGVDRRDGAELPWAGPPVHAWAARLDSDEQLTREILVAAVREVFEECGVLFASRLEDGRLVDTRSERWQTLRQRLVAREASLGEVLRDEELLLRTDLLRAHAHWMTPEIEPRQFDARIFAAVMPEGATADGETSEAQHSGWFRPEEVLAEREAGRAILMPPTVVCLEDLARAGSAAEFFAQEPVIRLIRPVLARNDAGEMVTRAQLPR